MDKTKATYCACQCTPHKFMVLDDSTAPHPNRCAYCGSYLKSAQLHSESFKDKPKPTPPDAVTISRERLEKWLADIRAGGIWTTGDYPADAQARLLFQIREDIKTALSGKGE